MRNALEWGVNDTDGVFLDIEHRYMNFPDVVNVIAMARILIRAVIMATLNTLAAVQHTDDHERAIVLVGNVFDAYYIHVYGVLRPVMIESNHHVSIIQRTWKRCVTDPEHPACRRRLEHEFADLVVTSKFSEYNK